MTKLMTGVEHRQWITAWKWLFTTEDIRHGWMVPDIGSKVQLGGGIGIEVQ